MNSDWVAATVRSRSMARRRAGSGLIDRVARSGSLSAGLDLLRETGYGPRLASADTLLAAQRATRDSVLWEVRVLAGWVPPGGTALLRAVAAAYEADNIIQLARRLAQGSAPSPAPISRTGTDGRGEAAPFELGSLATAWPRISVADSPAELADLLRRSPWGDPGPDLPAVLTAVRLRRLAAAAPEAADSTARAAALLAARVRLVGGTPPAARLVSLLRPLLGVGWTEARSLAELREALPARLQPLLADLSTPADLWRAESALPVLEEAEGFRLLRSGVPGPEVVFGAVEVLTADAWRLRAALAAAAGETGSSEVLNAVA